LKKAIEENYGIYATENEVFIYNGYYWSSIKKPTFKKYLGQIAIQYGMSKIDGEYYQFQGELLNQLMTTCYAEVPVLDIDIVHINLLNGTLEINKGVHKLKSFDKNNYLHYQLSFVYNEEATCPMWLNFLDEMLPDKNAQLTLAEYIGYLFIKNGASLKIEKVLALTGGGSNGKSVVNEICTALIGEENTTSYSLEKITDSSGYYVSAIENKLLNFPSESSTKLNSDTFKRIASGEPLSARPIREKPYTVTQYAKQMFNLNKDLQAKDVTHAYYRRFIILPFEKTISDADKDVDLSKKII
jgi:putative DNA primase/helicase